MVQAGNVHGGVHFYGEGGGATASRASRVIPRELPRGHRGFVDREDVVARLDHLLSAEGQDTSDPAVVVITGTAGVGKTSLALHWAHRVRDAFFPDGQLYVNLRGYDPGAPMDPGGALHRFLRALDVPSSAIPAEVEAKAALYRSLLAGRRMLVVLDNASTVGQVRPLLPGTPGSLALVTSRSRMSGLVARDGARRITLDLLPEPDAVELLRIATRDYRAADHPDLLAELARLCARLPLALRIAAERAASRPWMALGDLLTDLRDESSLWDALSSEDDEEADAVRTVFAWSYRALSPEAARLFRLLGLHPGPDFGSAVVAAMLGTTLGRARNTLDGLVGAHLLEQLGPGRYQFHDLLRAYAGDQATLDEPEAERAAVTGRMLSWYLHSAAAAQAKIQMHLGAVGLPPLPEGVTPLDFAEYGDAFDWYEGERDNLAAAVHAAVKAGLDGVAWRLAAVLHSVHAEAKQFDSWLSTALAGVAAARRAGAREGEARLLESVGHFYTESHRLDQAFEFHRAALAVRRDIGDRFGEALSLNGIGLTCFRARSLREARDHMTQGAAVFAELGDTYREAILLGNVGEMCVELGETERGAALVGRALAVFREVGDKDCQSNAMRIVSTIHRALGRPDLALAAIGEALETARDLGDKVGEGYYLLELARVQRELSLAGEALVSCQRASALHRRLADPVREALSWDATGEAYQDLDRHALAADFHRRAAAVLRDFGGGWYLARALGNLACALSVSESRAEASPYAEEALGLLGGFDDPESSAIRQRIADHLR
ncbi:tetratricopeptide repeat protein [Sinosporangium siamense]|uniref:ATP-binding protein n=1 Tax=Sinosporangium siamense TaxID=1367973 RepID=UPI0035E49D4B